MQVSSLPAQKKIEKILFLEGVSDYYTYIKNMYFTLKKFCKKIICFNRKEYYLKFGQKAMNQRLLEIIAKEKPDYVFTWTTEDEFYVETLLKIREISPNTKTVAIFGDDSAHYENSSRFYSLLFDYSFTALKRCEKYYRGDGIKNIFSTTLTDTESFKPSNLGKKFDVTFVGTQKLDKSGRYEFIKYLKDNGIKIRLYGFGWENYPEFRDIYHGPLKDGDVTKTINKSRINLCLSRDNFGNPQMKARAFEVGACKSFALVEYAPDYLDYFKENKEIVMFKTKEEMLEKVKYYLNHEKEREKIALAMHKKTIANYGLYNELKSFFARTNNENQHNLLPEQKGKVFVFTEKELNLPVKVMQKLTEKFDYIAFKTKDSEFLKRKDFFQAYSLEKSKKPLSCCDYYAYSASLGDYAMLSSKYAVSLFDRKTSSKLLDISQLMATRNFFLDNLDFFKSAFRKSGAVDFLTLRNTAFVSIPLVRIKNFNLTIKDYKKTKVVFTFKALYELYSLYSRKKISIYLLYYLSEILAGRRFLLLCLKEKIFNKNLWTKLKKSV